MVCESACNLPGEKVYCFVLEVSGVHIPGCLVLAPMAGITDGAFRLIARKEGAALVFTELISADGLKRRNDKTRRYLSFSPEERPIGIQLFGNDPDVVSEAVKVVEEVEPDFIDLNFGCPVRKVVRRGGGAALLRDLKTMQAMARAAVSAVSIPITAKIRSGWSKNEIVAVDAVRMLEDAGVCLVTVHARTQTAGFGGEADWDIIREAKARAHIPIAGNGDIRSPEDARVMKETTGCDLIMIGRGAMGRPWLFRHAAHVLATGELLPEPDYRDRILMCLDHYDTALRMKGPAAVVQMRKHIGWYLRGMPGSHRIRQDMFQLLDPSEVKQGLLAYAESLELGRPALAGRSET